MNRKSSVLAFLAVCAVLPPASSAAAPQSGRHGREVVETVCVDCHGVGLNGSPMVGDRLAWVARLSQGVEAAVQRAIQGHGGMPPRGGRADLTDVEVRRAILHMFDPEADMRVVSAPRPGNGATAPGAQAAVVGGMEIHFGLMPAGRLRAFVPGSPERSMHGGVPDGPGHYHVNVTLHDATTGAGHPDIGKATVDLRVEQAGLGGHHKVLERMALNGTTSFGHYVRMKPNTPTWFTVRVRRPGFSDLIEATFRAQPD